MGTREKEVEKLKEEIRIAKENFEVAKREARQLVAHVPLGLPHPDGTLRIRQVLGRESAAFQVYHESVQRLHRYLTTGALLPDRPPDRPNPPD